MSFILDALKKSETDRQQQASAEFASIPTSAAEPGTPKWIWAFGLLLFVNAAVVAFFLLRDGAPESTVLVSGPVARAPDVVTIDDGAALPTSQPESQGELEPEPASQPALQPPPGKEPGPGFRERLERTRAERSMAEREPSAPATTTAMAAVEPATVSATATDSQPAVEISSLALPTLTEIRLNDGVQLPDLHIDIHVYGATTAERFVFINMQKLNEGDTLDAGPQLEAITPDGVILDYRGTRFVLPRE